MFAGAKENISHQCRLNGVRGGAGLLVLEELEHAQARGAGQVTVIAGPGTSYHLQSRRADAWRERSA